MDEKPQYEVPYPKRMDVYTTWLLDVCSQTNEYGTVSVNSGKVFSWTVCMGRRRIDIALEPNTETMTDEVEMKEIFRQKLERGRAVD